MQIEEIGKKIEKLPDYLFSELNDFVDLLLKKHNNREIQKTKFKFDWEGGLSKLRTNFSSVELQHKASELR